MISHASWLSLKCDCKSATAALHSASIEGSPNAGPSTKSCNMSLSQCTIGHRTAHSRNVAARVRSVCTSEVYLPHFRLIYANNAMTSIIIEQYEYGKRLYLHGESPRQSRWPVSNLERLNEIRLGPSKLIHSVMGGSVSSNSYLKQPQATEFPPGPLSLVPRSSSPCVLPTTSPNQPTD